MQDADVLYPGAELETTTYQPSAAMSIFDAKWGEVRLLDIMLVLVSTTAA